MAKKTPTPPPEPMLPPTFILAASFALIGAGSSISAQDEELEQAAQLVAPLITRDGLFERETDLIGIAITESIHVAPDNHIAPAAKDRDDALYDLRMEAARIGVHVGLAAGFLLVQMIAWKDGAR